MVEVLRHTGVRIEELAELSRHSLIQYRLPDTSELIPLLQITPSKPMPNDCWPSHPNSPTGYRPSSPGSAVASPTCHLWSPTTRTNASTNSPMPLLFQGRQRLENRASPKPRSAATSTPR